MPADPDTPRRSPADNLPRRVDRTPGDYCRGQLKVDNLLRDEDRNDYYALLRKPGTTVRAALLWLRGRGYRVGRGAVKHHKQKFVQHLQSVRTSAEMSLACTDLLRQVGPHRMSDAAVVRFETLLTETLFEMSDRSAMSRARWDVLGKALNNAVGNRVKLETLRIAAEEAQLQAARAAKGTKQIDGVALRNKVRRIHGVPLPGEPIPGLPPPVTPESGPAASPSPGTPGEGWGEGRTPD